VQISAGRAIRQERLRNQGLLRSSFRSPQDAVSALGAVQAQDYGGAKWALGLRVPGMDDVDVETAFNDGAILRTHILRATWHFVSAADIRWLVALSGPRVNAANGSIYRTLGLDDRTLAKSQKIIERSLRDRNFHTRRELAAALQAAGLAADGQRLAYIMMRAELDGVVCSGPMRGKQFTYALLEERAPRGRTRSRHEALLELTRRYFASHGPATARDLGWWSGLAAKDVREGIALLESELQPVQCDGLHYWRLASARGRSSAAPLVHLLPNYDEYVIAYRDRGLLIDPKFAQPLGPTQQFPHLLAIDGRVRGNWRRTRYPQHIALEVRTFTPLSRAERDAVERHAVRYGAFVQNAIEISWK
jgi:hypothetical protein